jgi:hypothetical protein
MKHSLLFVLVSVTTVLALAAHSEHVGRRLPGAGADLADAHGSAVRRRS